MQPFHLAIPVQNLKLCRAFYGNILGCSEGRSSEKCVDFNFFGHQLVLHQVELKSIKEKDSNPVDGHEIPVPHFGVVLNWDLWEALALKLKGHKVEFIIEPYIRFEGETGEQATLFFNDPEGNALEFKAFRNISQLFAK
ncbi:MAG: VOC family protein [Bacteroidetes bacterium]|nr:VOC family protein [Bacteroidota bacterium]